MQNKKSAKSLYEVLIKELSQKRWKEHDKFYSIRQIYKIFYKSQHSIESFSKF